MQFVITMVGIFHFNSQFDSSCGKTLQVLVVSVQIDRGLAWSKNAVVEA